mgnify:FL=1
MEKVTFLQSIIKVLNLIASIPFFIEILILTAFLLIIMIFFYFRKSKKGKITSLIIYFVTLLLLPISHFSFFVETLDKIVENFIAVIYFPSCYVYIATLLITDFSILRNVIKNTKDTKRGKWYQILNLVYFFAFQFLFFLIIRVVITNNIDIFTRSSLYSNTNLTSLIQISSYLFWIRMGIKLIIFIIDRLSKFSFNKKDKKLMVSEPINNEDNLDNNSSQGLVKPLTIEDKNIDINNTVSNNINSNINTNINSNFNNNIVNNINNHIGDNVIEPDIVTNNIDPINNVNDVVSPIIKPKNNNSNKVVKPLDEGLINSKINLSNNDIDIDNSLYNMKPITPDIKPFNSDIEKQTDIIKPIIASDTPVPILKPTVETLDLSMDNNHDNIKPVEILDIKPPREDVNNSTIETLDINDTGPDLSIPSVINLSTDTVDKNNSNNKSVKSFSPFDILKETEQYVPVEQSSNLSGTNVNKDTVNNIDLTINDIDDDNDNYFDDFYD